MDTEDWEYYESWVRNTRLGLADSNGEVRLPKAVAAVRIF